MRVASRRNYDFLKYRAKGESARDFLEKSIDSSHVSILMEIAADMNISFLDACKYYFSMFNAIQDMVNMHHNFAMPHVTVSTLGYKMNGADRQKFVYSRRKYLSKPYLKNAATVWDMTIALMKKAERMPKKTKAELKSEAILQRKKEKHKQMVVSALSKKWDKVKSKKRKKLAKRKAVGLF